MKREPDRAEDGTAVWSIETLKKALRDAGDGLSKVGHRTIWETLHEAGYSWQKDRSWCTTGKVLRKRKDGVVEVTDIDAEAKKKLIEKAYTQAEALGLDVWCEDEAGPFQTRPEPGQKWCPVGKPEHYPHEYIRGGTAKLLTLFHPKDGVVIAKGVTTTSNAVIHPWLEERLAKILDALPAKERQASPEAEHALWEAWQEGMQVRFTLHEDPVPLRLILVLDNLTGHKSHALILWLYDHGVMPLFTPLGGSWLNMAESIQRILKRRGLQGSSPETPRDIMSWLEEVAEGWNKDPTPFVWGGKRAARRQRARQRRRLHPAGGSGACATRPIKRAVGSQRA